MTSPTTPTPQSVWKDPDFLQLDPGEQAKVMRQIDPDFSSMAVPDQMNAVLALRQKGVSNNFDPGNIELSKQGLSAAAPFASRPELAAGKTMTTSSAPQLLKAATSVIPPIAGTAGAIAGAPAFGGGAIVGGGLGTAGGIQAKLGIDRAVLGNGETSPISKQGLTETALGGALGGALEVPGAVLSAVGSKLLPRIAAAKDAGQAGDVIAGLAQSDANGVSRSMLLRDLQAASKADGSALKSSLANSTKTIDVDAVAQNTRNLAQQIMQRNPILKATPKRVDMIISAAKENAGITGNTASPQQFWEFMQQLQKPGFEGSPGPVAQVAKNLVKQMYRDSGQELRAAVPESDELLSRLTNYHAASDALGNYGIGRAGSAAVSAALNPKATAALSPIATIGAGLALNKAKTTVGHLADEFIK